MKDSMHVRQASGELQRKTLACTMNAHEQCRGTVSGGLKEGIRCLCSCHNDATTTKRYTLRETRTNLSTGRFTETVSPLSAVSVHSPLGQMMLFEPGHPRLRRLEASPFGNGDHVVYVIEEVEHDGQD